jgi:hypothetical protein
MIFAIPAGSPEAACTSFEHIADVVGEILSTTLPAFLVEVRRAEVVGLLAPFQVLMEPPCRHSTSTRRTLDHDAMLTAIRWENVNLNSIYPFGQGKVLRDGVARGKT